jgi:PPM family protein phosphatase
MALRFCSGTDPGRKRSNNQDVLLADPRLQLFIVADGMGGHRDGDVASRIVVDGIKEFFDDTEADAEKTWPLGFDVNLSYAANRLKTAILIANLRIAAHLAAAELQRGMGATLAAVQIGGDRAVVANVGDCRAYLLDGTTLRQITHDHSWVAEQVQSGFISPEAARAHPWRHVVTRAVQGDGNLQVDVLELELPATGRLLLCSDGLHALLNHDELAARLSKSPDTLDGLCSSLIQTANDRGAPDNVSVLVVDW